MNQQLAVVARQAGGQILPDNDQWTNRFQIKSESSTRLYTVLDVKNHCRGKDRGDSMGQIAREIWNFEKVRTR